MRLLWMLAWSLLTVSVQLPAEESAARVTPRPLPSHPGNIFLEGEEVLVPVPAGRPGVWRAVDYDEHEVTVGTPREHQVSLGPLPVGFYRLQQEGQTTWISCAVLQSLKAPTPASSPIALDVAMAWFYPKAQMDTAASLCALAGVNWVRDRLAWGQMEPEPGKWAAPNRYDESALAQARAGLKVIQVNHSSPSWANTNNGRFPLDLRDAYRFYREMAKRLEGRVLAFEPWNEADIPGFGGHTGAEMASLQKASWLGLKAGSTNVIGCLNVFALHNPNQLADLNANEAWPYFDTFNLHHYAPFEDYPTLYADFRAISAGKPLWVSECALPVHWSGDPALKEPSDTDLRVQAERVAKTFASSLHEGAAEVFYFMLPHYVEGQTQFGLLRPDLTPRPAYAALAAVGRLLADARSRGRLLSETNSLRGFLFRAAPDGAEPERPGGLGGVRVRPPLLAGPAGRGLRSPGANSHPVRGARCFLGADVRAFAGPDGEVTAIGTSAHGPAVSPRRRVPGGASSRVARGQNRPGQVRLPAFLGAARNDPPVPLQFLGSAGLRPSGGPGAGRLEGRAVSIRWNWPRSPGPNCGCNWIADRGLPGSLKPSGLPATSGRRASRRFRYALSPNRTSSSASRARRWLGRRMKNCGRRPSPAAAA